MYASASMYEMSRCAEMAKKNRSKFEPSCVMVLRVLSALAIPVCPLEPPTVLHIAHDSTSTL